LGAEELQRLIGTRLVGVGKMRVATAVSRVSDLWRQLTDACGFERLARKKK